MSPYRSSNIMATLVSHHTADSDLTSRAFSCLALGADFLDRLVDAFVEAFLSPDGVSRGVVGDVDLGFSGGGVEFWSSGTNALIGVADVLSGEAIVFIGGTVDLSSGAEAWSSRAGVWNVCMVVVICGTVVWSGGAED